MTFEEVKEQDNTYFMPTYGRFSAALDRGKNATAWDAVSYTHLDVYKRQLQDLLVFVYSGAFGLYRAEFQLLLRESKRCFGLPKAQGEGPPCLLICAGHQVYAGARYFNLPARRPTVCLLYTSRRAAQNLGRDQ